MLLRTKDCDSAKAASYLEVPFGLIQAAIAYYGAYTAEIDQMIELNNQVTAEAHTAYLAARVR